MLSRIENGLLNPHEPSGLAPVPRPRAATCRVIGNAYPLPRSVARQTEFDPRRSTCGLDRSSQCFDTLGVRSAGAPPRSCQRFSFAATSSCTVLDLKAP